MSRRDRVTSSETTSFLREISPGIKPGVKREPNAETISKWSINKLDNGKDAKNNKRVVKKYSRYI